jgi:tetratricopeptide (TPR) repeat protein
LIKAESELTLVQNADESARQAAAARALEALAQAEALGIESRALVLRRARYYDIAGDVNQRDLTLLAAEAITPKSALDFFLIGEELRRAGQLEKALTSYRQALQIDPSQFWSLHQMALTHLLGGQAEAAVAGYTACIARRPDERICYLTRGIAYASLSQIEPALADLNKARDLDPNLYAVYLNRGAVYVAKKDLEAAIADFKHAAELRPGHAGPFVNLGETYRIQENYDESEAALTKALELDANNSKAHRIRALTRLQLMKVDEARADFEQVIALDKDPLSQADAWQQIGKTWHRGGEPDMALEAYDQSIAANPKNSDTYRLKAEVLLSLNRDQDAVDAFTKFLEFGKPVGDVYRARSLAYSKLGLFREAMNDYTRALELEPSANMLVRRGWAYLMEANKLALADFDAAVSENPDNADAWNGRGYARVMMGDYPRAIADADEALTRAAKQIEAEGPSAWPHVYNAATIYAQAVGKVLQDGRRTSEDREKRASQLTIKAIQIIGQTLKAAGPGQQAAVIQTLQTDTAINPIRNRPEFRQAFAPKPPPNNN